MDRLETVKGWAITKRTDDGETWYLFDSDRGHAWCQSTSFCFVWPTKDMAKSWGLSRGFSKKQFSVEEITVENTWSMTLSAS